MQLNCSLSDNGASGKQGLLEISSEGLTPQAVTLGFSLLTLGAIIRGEKNGDQVIGADLKNRLPSAFFAPF